MSLIVTLTGMSTSGKSTLAKAMSASDCFKEAVSVTTRAMRPGEVHGVDYYFVNEDKFNEYVSDGVLLEHVRSHHAAYGVPAFEIDNILEQGKSPVIVLEPIGVQAIHRVAQDKGYSFMSGFVCTDMLTIMQRFFNRIDQQLALHKPVDYLNEAKRLHTIMTVEKSWAGIWPWDKVMTDLHRGENLANQVGELEALHNGSKFFAPRADDCLVTDLATPDCLDPQILSSLIADVAQGRCSFNGFLKKTVTRPSHIDASLAYP